MRGYRVQDGSRDVNNLLDPAFQVSHSWGSAGEFDDSPTARRGVSVCDSLESLATYLAVCDGIAYGRPGWVIVELIGDVSEDTPLDAQYGEYLVLPTEIVSVRELDDAFYDMIGAEYDKL
jgi:hypothetical protein